MLGLAATAIELCLAFGPAFYVVIFEGTGGYGAILEITTGFELAVSLVILTYRW